MDPWTRFEEALHTLDDPAAELGRVLRDLDSTDMGTRAERQELRASATALLAERGEVPLDAAIRECAAAWALGCQGWPSLYLSWAALRRSRPQLAIESLSRIPPRYFDDQDLHWRTVQALACEAEARIAQGERAQAGELLSRLNHEFRMAPDDEILAPPATLVRRLLEQQTTSDLLSTLVEGLDLSEWFEPEVASAVAAAIEPSSDAGAADPPVPETEAERSASKSMRAILESLRKAEREQYPVEIQRGQDWWVNWVYGFVVGVGEHWVILQSLANTVYIDGYEVFRLSDITDVAADREGGYIERAVAELGGRPEVDFRLPQDADTKGVLQASADYASIIGVYLEANWDSPGLFGHLGRLGTKKFDMQLINPRGVWTTGFTRWKYKDVTSLTVGGRYERALGRFGDERPTE